MEGYFIVRGGVPDYANPVSEDEARRVAEQEDVDIVSAREMAEAFPDEPPTEADMARMAAEADLGLLTELAG